MSELIANISLMNEEVLLPFVVDFFSSGLGLLFSAVAVVCVILGAFLKFFKVKY